MKIKIPATSANLGPGFDSLGVALKLYNEVNIKKQKFTSITIKGENIPRYFYSKRNYFIKVFDETYKKLTGTKENFKFEFINNIPFSRGLGSSSAVIVGAIASAYEMAGFYPKKETILNEALVYESHPDNISPAVYGGFVTSVVEKNSVISNKSFIKDDIKAVVVIPNVTMQTKKSRAALSKLHKTSDVVSNLSGAAFITSCFFSYDYERLKFGSKDRLHEEIRMKNIPELFKVRELAYKNGALLSTLSGSGSSFLNIVYKNDAKSLQKILRDNFGEFRVEIFDFDNEGFDIIEAN